MKKILHLLIVGFVLSLSSFASAAYSPLAFSLVPPLQFPASDFTVTGARLSVGWGIHRDIYGLDIGGLGNITTGEFVGIGISGGFNITHGTTTILGLQLAGVTNINHEKTHLYGLQFSLVNYHGAESTIGGVQFGLVNQAEFTNIYGVQLGIYNRAQEVYGFQFGLINVATNLHGVQIGLLNFNQKGLFTVSPFLNVGF